MNWNDELHAVALMSNHFSMLLWWFSCPLFFLSFVFFLLSFSSSCARVDYRASLHFTHRVLNIQCVCCWLNCGWSQLFSSWPHFSWIALKQLYHKLFISDKRAWNHVHEAMKTTKNGHNDYNDLFNEKDIPNEWSES